MRVTNIYCRDLASLSVSSSRQVEEKRPNQTIDADELFTDTIAPEEKNVFQTLHTMLSDGVATVRQDLGRGF
jgi:hypothetical protein